MTDNFDASESPTAAQVAFFHDRAKAGGDAKAAKARDLSLEAAANMPPLATLDDALQRLDYIGRLSVAGVIKGANANAAANSTKAWAAVHKDAKLIPEIERLERMLSAAEAAQSRAVGVVRQ